MAALVQAESYFSFGFEIFLFPTFLLLISHLAAGRQFLINQLV